MPRQKLVVIGNGMAGLRLLEELLAVAASEYDITVFGAEPHAAYNRIQLSSVLAGDATIESIRLSEAQWYVDNDIELHVGEIVVEIDRARRVVITDSGIERAYDRLVLATGSKPFILPVPGADLPGVVTFRDIGDVDAMLARAGDEKRAVVIGGGLLGLEAANGLARRGAAVTVVHLLDDLMERQLDRVASTMLRREIEARGIEFRMAARTVAMHGESSVTSVELDDGTHLDADLVVMAVGIRPNIELARGAELTCERGIVVTDTMQTMDPRVYAVGECVQHRGATFGLVAPLYEQAAVCANQLARDGYWAYRASHTATRLKVSGVDLFSAGDFSSGHDRDELLLEDRGGGLYKKLVTKDGRLIGAVLYGDTRDASWYLQLIRSGDDIGPLRSHLLFGPRGTDDTAKPSIADMPDDTQLCDCNGVCKGAIVESIRENGLTSLADVRRFTKASASCGACTPQVDAVLAHALGADYQGERTQPLCPCTTLDHAQVRAAVFRQRDAGQVCSVSELMADLEWRQPDGCAVCRPALNYYLLCAFPGEYIDDAQSRFVNERVHGNIQRDGTFSVVPRIFGGVTSPQQLRAIADAADKFDVPTLKITGGQRIDLLGVAKSDLPAIWADLGRAGMVSGHAYAKGLRTVKTCVGETWCRFGVQDSTAMGIRLEEATWSSSMPHKFKMAVSGCPRNCAEATIKDFGVVAVDAGWELHVGGNGGMNVRATDILCRVSSADEVEEHALAFIQLYREQARYGERTAPWIERVGLEHVRDLVVRDELGRRALARRFRDSQRATQTDPWAQRSATRGPADFVPLRSLRRR